MPVKPHQAGYFYFNFLFQLFTATQTKPQSLNGVSRSSVSLLIWTRRICSEGGGGGGGGGGGKGRITSKTRQIRAPVHIEKREFKPFAVTMPLFISLFIQQSIHLFLFWLFRSWESPESELHPRCKWNNTPLFSFFNCELLKPLWLPNSTVIDHQLFFKNIF